MPECETNQPTNQARQAWKTSTQVHDRFFVKNEESIHNIIKFAKTTLNGNLEKIEQ